MTVGQHRSIRQQAIVEAGLFCKFIYIFANNAVNLFSRARRKRLKLLEEFHLSIRRLTGSRIREKRLDLHLKQAAVAEAVGISPSYLNLIEHNRRRIGGKLLNDLAAVPCF